MIFNLLFGFLLVFAGRSLFWLCVGIVGFLIGTQCAVSLGLSNGWMVLFSAFILGSIGVVLAVSFEWVAVVFGIGFLGGGYLLMGIFPAPVHQDPNSWLIFVVGGIVGMCLMIITFDWALILISSLLGATLIVNAVYGPQQFRDIIFIGSLITGIAVQYSAIKDTSNQERKTERS